MSENEKKFYELLSEIIKNRWYKDVLCNTGSGT